MLNLTPATEVVGYTYEADYHCVDCTRSRFGQESNEHSYAEQGIVDSERNPIHPVFADSETRAGTACGTCYETYIEPYQDRACVVCIDMNEFELYPNEGIYKTNCYTLNGYPDGRAQWADYSGLWLCDNHYFNQCVNCGLNCVECHEPGEYAVRDNWYCYNCADKLFTVCAIFINCNCQGEEHTAVSFDERKEEFRQAGFVLPVKECILG